MRKKAIVRGALVGGLLTSLPAPLAASPLVLTNSQLLVALQSAGIPNLCMIYTYDTNGNRTSQVNSAYGASGATWGSAVFGCFSWTT